MAEANPWLERNLRVIKEYRENDGKVTGSLAERPLLLLTTTGAKSGKPFTTPLNYSTDGDRLVLISSRGGTPRHPDWYHNLVANPEVTIELDAEKFQARASTAQEPERTRLFDQQAAIMPFFDDYRKQVTVREIPVVVLERIK
jgi:deazaflavin-dependent oxidoreductase (nitroreductase family)